MSNPVGKAATQADFIDQGLRDFMISTYRLIAMGLLVTTLTAFITYQPAVLGLIINTEGLTTLGYVAMCAPLALLVLMMFGIIGKSTASLKVLFWGFVALKGPSLALLTMMYTGSSVISAMLATLVMFLSASLYGYVTKRDLTSAGSFFMVGLIGILIASIINIFLGSTMMEWVISVAGILIFTGLTAWETQALKESYDYSGNRSYLQYLFAMNLYLNIINLFHFILSLTGSRD